MKIAILGSPGVGKTNFAWRLKDLLVEPVRIVDEYVEGLRTTSLLEYGFFGSHIDNLQVVFKRREQELTVYRGQDSVTSITCGTVLDSTAYSILLGEEVFSDRRLIGLQKQRLDAIMQAFGMVYTETWDYDYAFLLRRDTSHIKLKTDVTQEDRLDAILLDLCAAFRAPVFQLRPSDYDDPAKAAFQTIQSIEENESTPLDESGVRSGGEDGEGKRDSAESVPDVPEQRRDVDEP